MVYARDRKEPYCHFFKDWFKFINRIKSEGLPYQEEQNPALKPFLVQIPQDVSSIQKSLNLGGACKLCDMFCHMCACKIYGTVSQLMTWKEGHLRCHRYCLGHKDAPEKCFHWEVDNNDEIKIKKQMINVHLLHDELRFFFRLLPEFQVNQVFSPVAIKSYYSVNPKFPSLHVEEDEDVQSTLTIKKAVTDVNRHTDPGHIDFIYPPQTCQVQTAYRLMLDKELILQKMYRFCSYSVEVKQKYLRLSI